MTTENRPYPVKDTFVLYRSYLAHIELLSYENRGIWITAVLHYVNALPLPEMPPEVRMAFSFVKDRIDEDHRKWLDTVDKKRKAGYRGGIASGISRRGEAYASSASKSEANEHDNEYVYDNDYVNDTVYVHDHGTHDRYQTRTEAKKGIERDIDLDAIVLQKIRNKRMESDTESSDEVLDDLGITKGR
jgi:hypothetical protein